MLNRSVFTTHWDVIVVGGGATGIIAAEKSASVGLTTLLLEIGSVSLFHDGARVQSPAWNGTRFALHDLYSFTGAALGGEYFQPGEWCKAVPGQGSYAAACLLGGGTAVNAAQQLVPPARYFDVFWPDTFKSDDFTPAIARVNQRMPPTASTSDDGKLYSQEVFNVMSEFITSLGGRELDFNKFPNQKNLTFGHQQFVVHKGQRGGPMTSYLSDARQRSNFLLQTETEVLRLIRYADVVDGVEVIHKGRLQTYLADNVILAAGVFGTSRILFRSGVGPLDVLTDAFKSGMLSIEKSDWLINDAIGRNLHDNPATTIIMENDKILSYNTSAAWTNPILADQAQVIDKNSGPLTFYGRVLNWWFDQPRPDGDGFMTIQSICSPDQAGRPKRFSCQFNLNEGATSRGRIGISKTNGSTIFIGSEPWYTNPIDLDTYALALTNVLGKFRAYKDNQIVVISPTCTNFEECKAYLTHLSSSKSQVGNRHWGGTTRVGVDDATKHGGTSAVDLSLRLYGTKNLFVVDAGLSPAPTTSNPACLYESVVELGFDRILRVVNARKNLTTAF